MMHSSARRSQQGATLILTLVFLALLALLGFSAFDASQAAARLGGNAVARNESLAVAQRAVEHVLSSQQFTQDPAAVAAALIPVDIDANGSIDYQAAITPAPTCRRVRTIPVVELNPDRSGDVDCYASAASEASGLSASSPLAGTGASLCASSEWNIRATVRDGRTESNIAVNQGVSIRTEAFNLPSACP